MRLDRHLCDLCNREYDANQQVHPFLKDGEHDSGYYHWNEVRIHLVGNRPDSTSMGAYSAVLDVCPDCAYKIIREFVKVLRERKESE